MERTEKSLTLRARETRGFFGLSELHKFFKEDVEPKFNSKTDCRLVLDFSKIIYWDISALLWIVVALHYFRNKNIEEKRNLDFRLRLPQPQNLDVPIEKMLSPDRDYVKSADYLRRWRLIDGLRNLADNPDDLLIESQKGYISGEPLYYFPRRIVGPSGLEDQLISLRLVEIRNLVDLAIPQSSREAKAERIETCVKEFMGQAVADILHNQCGIAIDVAHMFVTHLLYEGLENVLQHPNASIGMFSVSRIGADKLVLAIADNGDSICKTIYEHYRRSQTDARVQLPLNYLGRSMLADLRRDIIAYATKEGTSRKLVATEADWQETALGQAIKGASAIGLGLTHIRDGTIRDFKGNLTVVTDGIGVRFTTTSEDVNSITHLQDFDFPWSGNLLRIQIQVKEKFGSWK